MRSGSSRPELDAVRIAFEEVLERQANEQDDALDRVCGEDLELRRAVANLLSLRDKAEQEGFLARPLSAALQDDMNQSEDSDAPMPSNIGRYRIIERLGAGSAGVVYRAHDPAPVDREVAIKVMRQGAPLEALERFRIEQHALASLDHPGIARIHDSGLTPAGELYAVFECVDGHPITTFADRESLAWRDRIRLMIQACAAVQYAHQRGVIHRDLKPSNLLVTTSQARLVVKVIDFGVSKLLSPRPATISTEHGLVVGTLAYMAPEMVAGRGADTRIDVYALGVMLFELLEGRHPYQDQLESLTSLIQSIGALPKPALTMVDRSFRRDVSAIIHKATDPDPERRYASPRHLGDDLDALLALRPVSARSTSAFELALKAVERRPKTTAAAMIAVAVFAALIAQVIALGSAARADRAALQQTLSSLTDDVLLELAEMSGAGGPRIRLAELLDQRLQELRGLGVESSDIRLRHLRVLDTISDEHLERRTFDEAEQIRRIVLSELRSLLASSPSEKAIRRDLARATVRVGDVLGERGDRSAATPWYEEADAQIVALIAEFPDDLDLQDDYCWSLERRSVQHWREGRVETALALAEQRLTLAHDLLTRRLNDPVALHNVAAAHCQMANYAFSRGDSMLSEQHAAKAASFTDQLCAAAPTRISFRVLDIVARMHWARALRQSSETEKARDVIESLHARSSELARANPHHWAAARAADRVRFEFPMPE